MAPFVCENVVAEKVDAITSFERRRKFLKFLPTIKALMAVLLLLYWLTSNLFSGENLRRIISSGLTSAGIYIFVFVNIIIALIFSLSNNHQKLIEPDQYFQYVSSSAVSPVSCSSASTSASTSASDPVDSVSSSVAVSKSSENEEKTSEEKPETGYSSVTLTAGKARPLRREMVRTVSSVAEIAHAVRRKREITVMSSATTDHQVYRRSRSERIDVRGDARRSMRRMCDIDDLSSDEFRSTVETFIARKKKMLSKELMKL